MFRLPPFIASTHAADVFRNSYRLLGFGNTRRHGSDVAQLGVVKRFLAHSEINNAMSCLGVHFSLSTNEVRSLRAIEDEAERVEHLHDVIEEEYFRNQPGRKAESDKAWDAMHRALSGGRLTWDSGDYPLNHLVLGGERLYTGTDFIMTLKTPAQVHDVAAELSQLTEAGFRQLYFAIDADSYGCPLTEEDCEYTWEWFQGVRDFWLRAAAEGRYVLFTADQ